MDINIANLRKLKTSDFSKITKAIETLTTPSGNFDKREDERMWKLTVDKTGNGSATIRFLPSTNDQFEPWVKIIDHGFQGPGGKWYIEKSLATIGKEDPVSQLNSELWNNGTEAGKEQARKQKRRTAYYANILVINDHAAPENNGTIRIFKFGKKIMDKIIDKSKPTFADERPVNVFDYWDGANFKLRQKKVEGYPNYDSSVFDGQTEVADSDDEIVKIAKSQHDLQELVDPKNFKSYAELKAKLDMVLNGRIQSTAESEDFEQVSTKSAPEPRSVEAKSAPSKPAPKSVAFDEDEDDDFSIARFKSLAND